MKFLLDENFPNSAMSVIENCGHSAISFSDVCERGADDDVVFRAAQNHGAVLLTSDRDFYHTMPTLHPNHAGIVVIALRQPNRTALHARLKWFLDNWSQPLKNRVVVLRDFTYRIK